MKFAPQLFIPSAVYDISFYAKAFGAVELQRWANDDGSIHVVELSIGELLFHLHEDTSKPGLFSPDKHNGTTVVIGLFTNDVYGLMNKAIEAGATEISPAKDHDYGYRQGEIKDLFGHHWLIQMKL